MLVDACCGMLHSLNISRSSEIPECIASSSSSLEIFVAFPWACAILLKLQVDVWSTGIVFFELCLGIPDLMESNPISIIFYPCRSTQRDFICRAFLLDVYGWWQGVGSFVL